MICSLSTSLHFNRSIYSRYKNLHYKRYIYSHYRPLNMHYKNSTSYNAKTFFLNKSKTITNYPKVFVGDFSPNISSGHNPNLTNHETRLCHFLEMSYFAPTLSSGGEIKFSWRPFAIWDL